VTQNLNDIQRELDSIKSRNKKVEADKAWETSWARKILIAIITYALIVIFMYVAKLDKPLIGALIPTVAFLLSVSTLPFFKRLWIKKFRR